MLKAPRSILEKQRRIVIVSNGVNPGPCLDGAHHEHRCAICGQTTTGIGDSFCPEPHKEKAVQDYWDKELKKTFYGRKIVKMRDSDIARIDNRMNQSPRTVTFPTIGSYKAETS